MNLSSERFVRLLASLRPEDGVTSDQRQQPRATVRASVLLAPYEQKTGLGSAYAVRLLNLSGSGAALQTVTPMIVGKQFVLDLPDNHTDESEAQDDSQRMRVLCKVVHCRSAGATQFQIGAQFLRLWTAPAPTLDTALAAA
jgi:hypothetical protein